MPETTLIDLFQASAANHPQQAALRYEREGAWHEVPYEQLQRLVEDLAGGLIELGLQPGERVAIWSNNRPEWVIADQAILHANAATLAIPPSLGPRAAVEAMEAQDAKIAFVDDAATLETLLKHQTGDGTIEHVITMMPPPSGFEHEANLSGMHEVYAQGRQALEEDPDPWIQRVSQASRMDDARVALRGDGSAVVASHGEGVDGLVELVEAWNLEEEAHLSLEPFAGAFAHTMGAWAPLARGGVVCFLDGSTSPREALAKARPTVVVAKPGVFEDVEASTREDLEAGAWWRRALAGWALDGAGNPLDEGSGLDEVPWWARFGRGLAERLVLEGIRASWGGGTRLFVAPYGASRSTARFFAGCGVRLVGVYPAPDGGSVALEHLASPRWGSVGQPVDGVRVRIKAGKGEQVGEIVVEPSDGDGWLTGDVGYVDEEGFVFVTEHGRLTGARRRAGPS